MRPRYQKHTRLATSLPIIGSPFFIKSIRFLIVLLVLAQACIIHGSNALGLSPERGAFAQAPGANPLPIHFVITSPKIPEIELLTHTVDMQLQVNSSGAGESDLTQLRPEQLVLTVQASYRFHNVGKDGRTVRLTLSPASNRLLTGTPGGTAPALTQQASVLVDNQAVGLQSATDNTSTFQLALAPDQRSVVLVNYSIPIGAAALPTIVYPVDWMDGWSNEMSLRVNVRTNSAIPPESWTGISPDGWNYALSNNIQQPDIKWLYDVVLPESAFQMQFAHPLLWQALQSNITASVNSPGAASFLSVGNIYKQLYLVAASSSSEPTSASESADSTAELFYSQAVAAYTEGIQAGEEAGDAPSALALLHAQLASLYRNKIIASGDSGSQYAALTAQEAMLALAQLPAESALRAELTQWQIDGLYSLFQEARQQRQWSESLAYIEQLVPLVETNPTPAVNVERLNEIRRIIIIQEALDVLEGGNKDAAIALAGPEIADAALQPAPEEQSLFLRWEIETTVQAGQTLVGLNTFTDGQQLQRAQNGLSNLIGSWQRSGLIRIDEPMEVSLQEPNQGGVVANSTTDGVSANPGTGIQNYALTVTFAIDHDQPRDVFLQTLPVDANWALLRELFRHLTPQVESVGSLFTEDQAIRMNLDLRAAGDHWDTMAAKLRRNAEDARAESANSSTSLSSGSLSSISLGGANAALAARIRAVNFANEAEVWQNLSQNSWVMVRMEANAARNSDSAEDVTSNSANSENSVSRSWLATVKTPPQSFQIEAASLASGRIALLLVSVILGLFIFSGLLWWLL